MPEKDEVPSDPSGFTIGFETAMKDPTKRRFIEEFRASHYVRHNQRRQEHLASLGLPIAGRSVLELGAGIGDHTGFFFDRGCAVCVSDGRPELYEILKERYHWTRVELLDLEKPSSDFRDTYEIVYAYGLLYHLANPDLALENMARWCSSMLLLETCVSPVGTAENQITEQKELGSQAVSGTGSRPGRRWVFEKLGGCFLTSTRPKLNLGIPNFLWTGTIPPATPD